jgi:hypothetical protein
MSSFKKYLFISMIAVGLSAPALAQPKADAGSGPTSGATSANDAGSGPTKGAMTKSDKTTASPSSSQLKTALALLRAQNQRAAHSL